MNRLGDIYSHPRKEWRKLRLWKKTQMTLSSGSLALMIIIFLLNSTLMLKNVTIIILFGMTRYIMHIHTNSYNMILVYPLKLRFSKHFCLFCMLNYFVSINVVGSSLYVKFGLWNKISWKPLQYKELSIDFSSCISLTSLITGAHYNRRHSLPVALFLYKTQLLMNETIGCCVFFLDAFRKI